ncbi:MAG TPA: UvrD-helicase domain-containing protein [Pelagibacterium sp.]|uniref:ATP-dependent helicase n=1 Tax=Pelagibacterium sp. TaxID=1967288 RepID=UPI002D0CC534|nr:UvrD-helicase domain-containing protein [Pelagibacterium sp.]HWJ88573.1 UvrD-helicase domain-containing protein [Pelagibacterium sp.]
MSAAPPPRPLGPITSQFAAREPAYLAGLNAEQRDAVETTEGPLLVLAGAGTGKTRVLTTRIAHILATHRAHGSQILAVTFTNKAAREMKERIGKLVGPAVGGMPWLGTFHSIGARIIRRHAELVGLRPDFTILDTDDQIRLIKQLLQAENIDEKRWPARQFANMLDNWKNRGLLPKDISPADSGFFANGKGQKLYADYQARLKTLNAADFGDLLLEGIRLFKENPEVLAEYHDRFRYMLVDEYQDSNTAQYLWLRLLAQSRDGKTSANICVVGDDDQSIYGWRGAEVDNILRFEKDFPGAKIIKLERNYRSTSNILSAASHLIANNESRLGKTLQTDVGEEGEKLSVTSVWDSEEEARQIGEDIEQFQRQGDRLDDMAILVRASFQMREFEERFITLGLNYRVIGGPRFYERREIRDALAYLRLVANPDDDLAFDRIINVPKRGLGDVTLQVVNQSARALEKPRLATLRELIETEELKPRPRTILRDFLRQIDNWAERMRTIPHHELAEQILDESGYTAMWQNDKSADAPGRLENLKELVRSMEEFENLGGFLEHIALVMDRDSGESGDAVSIMTLHSAKGLEFDTVFLPGWEEGLFPHQRSLDETGLAGLEEERRLAYVGITRARKRCRISLAQNRRIHGLWQSAIPSRFLDELPAHVVEVTDTGSSYGGYTYGGRAATRFDKRDPFESVYETPGWQRAQRQQSQRKGPGPLTIDGELVARSSGPSTSYTVGQRVLHLKFGYGTITATEGNKLSIDFENVGPKKVLDSFVKPG